MTPSTNSRTMVGTRTFGMSAAMIGETKAITSTPMKLTYAGMGANRIRCSGGRGRGPRRQGDGQVNQVSSRTNV